MTALEARRQSNLRTAGAIAAVSVLLMVLAIVVGVSSLARSTAGRDVTGGDRPDRLRLPATPTAALAVTDAEGQLVSIGVLVLKPGGAGGSLIPIPATAALGGESAVDSSLVSLADIWVRDGAEGFEAHLEAMAAVSLDLVESARAEDLAALFGIAEPLSWVPPDDLGSETLTALIESDIVGRSVLPGVARELSASEVGALISWRGSIDASDSGASVLDLEAIRLSVWSALVAGISVAGPDAPAQLSPADVVPSDIAAFFARLGAAEVSVRGLGFTESVDLDTVELDRAEVVMVFAQIAPARVAAPNESTRFRIVAALDDAQQAELGRSNADLARDLIAQLLFLDANVISVQTAGSPDTPAPLVTRIEVGDPDLVDLISEQWSRVFGEFDISVADPAIEGVDATIVIGMGISANGDGTMSEESDR